MRSTAGLVILGLGLALTFTIGLLWRGQPRAPGPDYQIQVALARAAAERLPDDVAPGRFVDVASRVRPSVVSIQASAAERDSTGTGVILDADGHILTNHHVVKGSESIRVTLSSQESYGARLVGTDTATDLAVLHIATPEPLLPAAFARSEGVLVGQEVLAIGNAYGFGWTVTHGIVSSLHRHEFGSMAVLEDVLYANFVQSDAPVNPGNSGGPLVDLAGRVIGINTLIVSETGASSGIAFALPADDAQFVASELVRKGRVDRGYLGITGRDLSLLAREERARLGVHTTQGAVVTNVVPGTPAAEAGFRRHDVILSVDGSPVRDFQGIRHQVARTPIGTQLRFILVRDGGQLTLAATVVERRAQDS